MITTCEERKRIGPYEDAVVTERTLAAAPVPETRTHSAYSSTLLRGVEALGSLDPGRGWCLGAGYSRGLICVGSGVARLHRSPLLPALHRVNDDPDPEAEDHDAGDHLTGDQRPSPLGHGRNITEPDG